MDEYLRDLMESYGEWTDPEPGQEEMILTRPKWLTNRGDILEKKFCDAFLHQHALCSCNGTFFDLNGAIRNEGAIRKKIYNMISPWVHCGISRKVDALLSVLRYEADDGTIISIKADYLHVANGTYDMASRSFVPQQGFCRHRFPVRYNVNAPRPERWLKFLGELLEEEDIPTLQEYMGYCLFPTTRAQKMLMIIGNGGEGKSRIGVVMKALLGEALHQGSLAKVEHNAFARADLENVLVMVDDDMKMEAFKQTNYIKSIITAEYNMDLEKKGIQSYQGRLYVRFLGFGNGSLQALHDRSHGFFRRQIILRAKPRPSDRVDDPFLDIALKKELEGIFLWCIEGWERLFLNDFRFTLSPGAHRNMSESIADSCNIPEFMDSQGYFLRDEFYSCSSRNLYRIYTDWCDDNSYTPLSQKTFFTWLKENAPRYHLQHINSVPIGNGRYAKGFRGIRALPR